MHKDVMSTGSQHIDLGKSKAEMTQATRFGLDNCHHMTIFSETGTSRSLYLELSTEQRSINRRDILRLAPRIMP